MLETFILGELKRLRAVAARNGLTRLDEMLMDAALVACSEIQGRAELSAARPRLDA
jgi:hypothetical protein